MTRRPKLWKVWTCACREVAFEPSSYLVGRLAVERQNQNLVRGYVLTADEVGELPDDDRGLARSRPSEHKGRVLVGRDGLRACSFVRGFRSVSRAAVCTVGTFFEMKRLFARRLAASNPSTDSRGASVPSPQPLPGRGALW